MDLLIVVPVIVGLTEVFKRAGLSSRYVPALAVFFGLGFAFWTGGFEIWLDGIIAGLSAVGLWNVGKRTLLGK